MIQAKEHSTPQRLSCTSTRPEPEKSSGSSGLNRSNGDLTSKIHSLVDAENRPVALKVTAGEAHDGRSATDMLDGLSVGQILLG